MRDSRRTRWVLAVLLVFALGFVIVDSRGADAEDGGPLGSLREGAAMIFGPIESGVGSVVEPVRDFFGGLGSWGDSGQRIAELEAQVETLKREAFQQARSNEVAAALESLFGTAGRGGYTVVPAQVVAVSSALALSQTVTIDVGRLDGVTPEMSVITGDGLVGQVISVTDTTAVVQLIIDEASRVAIRLEGAVQEGAEIGFAAGTGGMDRIEVSFLTALTKLETGTRLVTRGSPNSRPYVAGVPVGEIVSKSGSEGTDSLIGIVRPYVDFSSLDIVGVVVVPPRTDPRDSVLPPRPTTSPGTGSGSPEPSGTGPSGGTSPNPGGSGSASSGSGASGDPSRSLSGVSSSPGPSGSGTSQ